MLNVTKPALTRLSDRLTFEKATADVALRFTRRERSWRLDPDRARPGDVTFAHDGRNVLLLDQAVAEGMTDLTLDVRRTTAGPRFRLRRATSPAG
jgi:hypothetical protein